MVWSTVTPDVRGECQLLNKLRSVMTSDERVSHYVNGE